MSNWDKFYYYVGLVGIIGIPIVMVVEVMRLGWQTSMLRGVFAFIVFGVCFLYGLRAKQAAAQQKITDKH